MKATPEDIAKCLDDAIAQYKADIQRITDKIQFICEHHWRICKIGVMPSPSYNGIDFDSCERDEALAIMKAFGGKWDKSPNYTGKGIDYTQYFADYSRRIQISNAKPPASCEIVEEDVIIPAQPERKRKKFTLKCKKPVEGETATLPVPELGQVQSVEEITPQEIENGSESVESTEDSQQAASV